MPFFVVVLLDGGGHNAGNTNTVAAHFHDLGFAVIVQEADIHGLGIFVAQLEDMADFNTASQFQTALFVRADIAFDDITQIDKFRLVSISAEVEAGIVVVVFVRADNPICAFFGGEIGIDFAFKANRAERAAVCAELRADGGRGLPWSAAISRLRVFRL